MISVPIQKLPHAQDLDMPFYATPQSAGMDVCAAIEVPIILQPHERKLIPLGFSIALPDGYEAQIRSRSGLAIKFGICVLNAPGTIDSDYRGEIQAILINLGETPFTIERGMRIAQLVIATFTRIQWQAVTELPASERNANGFGSTGL